MAMSTKTHGTPEEVAKGATAPANVEQKSNDKPPTREELERIIDSVPAPPWTPVDEAPDEPGEPNWPAMPVEDSK